MKKLFNVLVVINLLMSLYLLFSIRDINTYYIDKFDHIDCKIKFTNKRIDWVNEDLISNGIHS